MEASLLSRTGARSSSLVSTAGRLLLSSSQTTRTPASGSLPLVFRRHKATTRRMKKALNIAPHPSFLSAPDAPGAQDHIIFNPPAAAPSVYHTPFKFLPKSDPRRRANLTSLFTSASTTLAYPSPSSPSSSSSSPDSAATATLPPALGPDAAADAARQRYHLSKEDVAEMRRLRAEDAGTWSVLALARRYNANPLFVMMCCQATPEKREADRARLEKTKARWGPIRTQAREDRRRRREMLYRGEI